MIQLPSIYTQPPGLRSSTHFNIIIKERNYYKYYIHTRILKSLNPKALA